MVYFSAYMAPITKRIFIAILCFQLIDTQLDRAFSSDERVGLSQNPEIHYLSPPALLDSNDTKFGKAKHAARMKLVRAFLAGLRQKAIQEGKTTKIEISAFILEQINVWEESVKREGKVYDKHFFDLLRAETENNGSPTKAFEDDKTEVEFGRDQIKELMELGQDHALAVISYLEVFYPERYKDIQYAKGLLAEKVWTRQESKREENGDSDFKIGINPPDQGEKPKTPSAMPTGNDKDDVIPHEYLDTEIFEQAA